MTNLLDKIPDYIKLHIKEITKTSGLPDSDESIQELMDAWVEKENIFEDKAKSMNMEIVDTLDINNDKGALVLTYSGSLLTIGALNDGKRTAEYASIGLRHDVPGLVTSENCVLEKSLVNDERIEFKSGPVRKTSPVYKIAVCKDDMPAEDQNDILKEASTVIMEDFVEVNKTLVQE